VSDGRGRPVNDGGLARWLASVAPVRARGEVGVALVTDARIRRLNARYRRKDAVTDVLSFPSDPASVISPGPPAFAAQRLRRGHAVAGSRLHASGGGRIPDPGSRVQHLGDIVIASGVARRQAREAGHSYSTELRVLALHGLLHLLGYDHEDAGDAGRMARAEARLRARGRLKRGLIERST